MGGEWANMVNAVSANQRKDMAECVRSPPPPPTHPSPTTSGKLEVIAIIGARRNNSIPKCGGLFCCLRAALVQGAAPENTAVHPSPAENKKKVSSFRVRFDPRWAQIC